VAGTPAGHVLPHPPVVPQMVWLFGELLGDGTFALRLGSLLCGTGSIVLAYLLGHDLYSGRAGLWAAALTASTPFLVAIHTVATPDSPLVFLWLLFMWVTWRAVQSGRTAWWLTCGVVFALGLYTST